jgi:predicted DsbA family dithiol-disulfide isomerase
MSRLRVDVWSDIACPWCYVGKRRLELALEQFPHRAQVEVVWHAFELDPAAPREVDSSVPHAVRLAKKYGSSVQTAELRTARLTELARADGLELRFDRLRPGNTFDAHRLLHLAKLRGVQDAVKERFLRGYLSEGEPIGKPEVLVRLAAEAGLDAEEAHDTLVSGNFADEVRADEQEAHELGINGVPFFVLAERYAVSGAQPAELLLAALERAYGELEPEPLAFVDGAVWGPDGC